MAATADTKTKSCKQEDYLLKAAELLNDISQEEAASYLIFQSGQLRSEAARRKELHNGGLCLSRTPQKADKKEIDNCSELTCQFCGSLQTPLICRVRIKPRIRKKRNRTKTSKFIEESTAVIGVNRNEETPHKHSVQTSSKIDSVSFKKKKSARRCPAMASKCMICKEITKTLCHVPKKVRQDRPKKVKNFQGEKKMKYLIKDGKEKFSMLNKLIDEAEASSNVNSLTKSAKKRQRMKNNPLAKLLSQNKNSKKSSPSLQSFLFSS